MAARARSARRFIGSLLLNSVFALAGNAYAGALHNTDWPAYNNTANGQRCHIRGVRWLSLERVCGEMASDILLWRRSQRKMSMG